MRGTSRVKNTHRCPWLPVITGGESLVSHAGGVLLVETARRSRLAKELSSRCRPWRRPLAVHHPGKIVLDLALAVALGGDAAGDIGVLRAQPAVFGLVASDSTVSRLVATLAKDTHLATYEPKRLRLRILAVAARIVTTARRHTLKIDPAWPRAETITTAYTQLTALPAP